MLLLLHEQDKMAPDWSHPEVNNNIRSSSEAIPPLILGDLVSVLLLLSFNYGFSKGRIQLHSSKRIL
uniref:Uncharacterized protein n=1 Tax=Prolemur simus TaxID=1328070 RepID=A0A8C9DI77_PROSS